MIAGAKVVDDRQYWEKRASLYDVATRAFARPMAHTIRLTVEALKPTDRVLEVAAGTGAITTTIAPVVQEVVATDYAAAMVDILQARVKEARLTNVRCERADLYALPYEAGSFDVVLAANVLHLVPDLAGAIVALRRVLRPGGRLIVPTFCHRQTVLASIVSWQLALTGFPGKRRFTLASLRDALETAGLRIQRIEALSGLIPIGYVEGVF